MRNIDRAPDLLALSGLSKSELLQVIGFMTACQTAGSEAAIKRLVPELADLVAQPSGMYSIIEVDANDSPTRILKSFSLNGTEYNANDLFPAQLGDAVKASLASGDLYVPRANAEDASGKSGLHVTFCRRFSMRHIASCFLLSMPQSSSHIPILRFILPLLHGSMAKLHLCAGQDGCVLTEREREVLNWCKYGKTNWEISLQLNVTARTVKFHMENAMRKIGANNRSQAIAAALSRGLLD